MSFVWLTVCASRALLALLLLAMSGTAHAQARGEVYRSAAFTLTDRSVAQGQFLAIAPSRDRIESNYQRAAVEVNFKFSINGLDNEHPPGDDYMIYLRPRSGRQVTPVYRFGVLEQPSTPAPTLASASREEGPVEVTFRLDMRHVLDSLRVRGTFKPRNGEPIRQGAITGIYVIGNVAPLSWDFSKLVPGAPMQLHDADGDGIYEATLRFHAGFSRPLSADGRAVWQLRRDLARFPTLESPQRLVDALHKLALEELLELERADGALNAGGRWPGVWTRDLAWSALLGVALIAPNAVRAGLLARVDTLGRIIQDSGSGGSWPLSTDRVAWALAAWELYAVTGDSAWLRTAYDVIRRSAEADLTVAFDASSGLFRGESSFLDWREQSYPRWMDAKDIGHAQALGTNVLHYGAYRVLGRMARLLGEPAARWDSIATAVRNGLNDHMWHTQHGYYGQFRYGRLATTLSPRAEHLGAALGVVFGVPATDRRAGLLRRLPVVPYGVPSFWPYIPDVPPYHNAGVWPQVVGFFAWAAADAGNSAAVEHALANLFRASALFLTNKENWVATTGHFEGTEVNSDRFGASVAAQLAAHYRVLFGIRAEADHLRFAPFVPRAYAGTRTLRNLRYRNMTLTVIVHGFGDAPRAVRLDGKTVERAAVPATLSGTHTIEITLDGELATSAIALVDNVTSPATPVTTLEANRLTWRTVAGADSYVITRGGERLGATRATEWRIAETGGVSEYQVQAVSASGLTSFFSEPVRVGPADAITVVEPNAPLETSGSGYDGGGYVTLRATPGVSFALSFNAPTAGWYAVDARYANGNGPVSYGYRASARGLLVDGRRAGTLLLPQRGQERWDDWGYTNAVRVWLAAGPHTLSVEYTPADRNMDGIVDHSRLDHLRITRLADVQPPRTRNERRDSADTASLEVRW